MDTDKIIQDLNRRFAAPLPEFYQRRIIFWYDEDKEFEDKLDEVVLENAKVIVLTGNNAFSVKKLLSVDDLTTNYLVYSPCVYNRPDDNWLLDDGYQDQAVELVGDHKMAGPLRGGKTSLRKVQLSFTPDK